MVSIFDRAKDGVDVDCTLYNTMRAFNRVTLTAEIFVLFIYCYYRAIKYSCITICDHQHCNNRHDTFHYSNIYQSQWRS